MAHHPFRFGVVMAQARSAQEWTAKAQHAEALGFTTILIPDTLGPTLAPFPALAFAAATTRSIRLGTYVLATDLRNPVFVARESATLDMLSGGRFELGLGAGRPGVEADYAKAGLPVPSGGARVDRLAEALAIIKTTLSGHSTNALGPNYPIAGADVFPQPVQQPHPPIMLAGSGKRLLSLAAREANIVALAVEPTADQAAVAERIGWLQAAAPERFDALELNLSLIAVGDQSNQYLLARYGITPAQLVQSGSVSAIGGTVDAMCEQLREQRATLGVSYFTTSENCMGALAPVIERLAGT